jgi:outer membrane receptor protein involved in Fe transport
VPTASYQSEVFFEDDNQQEYVVVDPATGSVLFEVPETGESQYTLFNIRAGFEFMNGRAAVEAFASNLFDTEYVIDAGNTGGGFGIPTFIAGPPRFYGARLRLQY